MRRGSSSRAYASGCHAGRVDDRSPRTRRLRRRRVPGRRRGPRSDPRAGVRRTWISRSTATASQLAAEIGSRRGDRVPLRDAERSLVTRSATTSRGPAFRALPAPWRAAGSRSLHESRPIYCVATSRSTRSALGLTGSRQGELVAADDALDDLGPPADHRAARPQLRSDPRVCCASVRYAARAVRSIAPTHGELANPAIACQRPRRDQRHPQRRRLRLLAKEPDPIAAFRPQRLGPPWSLETEHHPTRARLRRRPTGAPTCSSSLRPRATSPRSSSRRARPPRLHRPRSRHDQQSRHQARDLARRLADTTSRADIAREAVGAPRIETVALARARALRINPLLWLRSLRHLKYTDHRRRSQKERTPRGSGRSVERLPSCRGLPSSMGSRPDRDAQMTVTIEGLEDSPRSHETVSPFLRSRTDGSGDRPSRSRRRCSRRARGVTFARFCPAVARAPLESSLCLPGRCTEHRRAHGSSSRPAGAELLDQSAGRNRSDAGGSSRPT